MAPPLIAAGYFKHIAQPVTGIRKNENGTGLENHDPTTAVLPCSQVTESLSSA
jgi:hypothetical protein